MPDDDRLGGACARLARENGWPDERRERLADLLADKDRRRALSDHPRRLEFLGRVPALVPGGQGATDRTDPPTPTRRRCGSSR